jgi:hypothetical protein
MSPLGACGEASRLVAPAVPGAAGEVQAIVLGYAGRNPRLFHRPLHPSNVVGEMAIIHELPAFQIGLNIMEINILRVIHN